MKKNSTRKKNIAFDKLPPARKRVAIARDVIEQLDAKKYIAEEGSYVVPHNFGKKHLAGNRYFPESAKNKSLKEYFCDSKKKACQVCAKGSLFLSYVSKVNDFKVGQNMWLDDRDTDAYKKLSEVFSSPQLELIEGVFENYQNRTNIDLNQFYRQNDLNYFEDDYADKCLRVICKNIIKNRGTFKP
jgi:hypothetical protein